MTMISKAQTSNSMSIEQPFRMFKVVSTDQKRENIMFRNNPIHFNAKRKPNTLVFMFTLIQAQKNRLSGLARKVFELVLYGLTVINSSVQVVLLSLRIIATYQFFLEQVNSQDNIKNGGVVVLNKKFRSTISYDASRIHHLLSQIGG